MSLVLAHEFARRGHGVEFVLMRAQGELLPEAQREFPVVDLGAPRVRNVLPALVRYLRQRRPKALLVDMWPLTVIAPVATRFAGFNGKVVVSEHCVLTQQYRTWGLVHNLALQASAFWGYRLASARVGVSVGVCADMAKLSRLPQDQFTVIYNPVRRPSQPLPEKLREANALWGSCKRRILTVGNLKEQKNHALLLRALAILNDLDARLMLVGCGPLKDALHQQAQELGIADRVIFAGFHADPSPFYATADLFVLSSSYEGFGNVIVEALSFGLPVVSTDCPSGPAEILEDGRFGQLVPVGDAVALARGIETALNMPADRDALIRRAADFDPEIAAQKYLELLGLS
ncbi:Glycosyltransferase involved in cell wall bisynthesis [Fontimonas thermophila]|uniref:Glycosyltransferase involved in cell wall bisynthesis n=2 Tax=Fontimonas thermophila TaxID=1076937 RepID=A0A1I2IJT1_9GAMM|nr:Glycosyltransferase involved in cell wall bisynthesis [Fontimonas thermophila]